MDGATESDISGATGQSYTAVAADVGKTLRVKASFVDDLDNDEGPLTSLATAEVVPVNTAATGAPAIGGPARVGHVLTASAADISDADGKTKAENGDPGYAYTYQWVRVDGADESDIPGATSESYTVAAADLGKTLKVEVSFVDDRGNDEGPLGSAATAAVELPEVTIAAEATTRIFREHSVIFILTRPEAPANALTVTVNLTQEKPYLANLSHRVTFPAGSATATLVIPAGDFRAFPTGSVIEKGTLTGTVADGDDYDVGTPASATVDILISLTFTVEMVQNTVSEESGDKIVFKVIARTGEGAPAPTSTIYIAVQTANGTAMTNYDLVPVSIIIHFHADQFAADGSVYKAERTIEVEIIDDHFPDSGETFQVNLWNAPNGSADYLNNLVGPDGTRCVSEHGSPLCRWTATITDSDPEGPYIEEIAITSSPASQLIVLRRARR